MKTSVLDVYAAGDCASVWSKLLDKPMYIALGTNANKQGRLAGDAVLGKNVRFARALGTSMLRVMGMEFAKTGLGEQECKANGIDYKTTTVESRSHARYYPDPVTPDRQADLPRGRQGSARCADRGREGSGGPYRHVRLRRGSGYDDR